MNAVDNAAEYRADVSRYRRDFRRYLQELSWADQWRAVSFTSAEDELAFGSKVLAELYAQGWNRLGWPVEVGGLGGDEIHRAVYYEEIGAAMLPIPAQHWTLETLGPALIHFAPDLASQYLSGYLDGSEWWGQSFSEPESGSDLASLRTRASVDGDELVINGQKIWTSQGPTARRVVALVRTGTPESRHRGLTMVLVDTDTPGVTVRPIALASGRRELAEIFFDDVHVPRERVIGEIDGGWAVTMYLMQYERGMYGYAVLNKAMTELGRLREYMVTAGSTADRARFGEIYIQVVCAQARTAETVRRLARGEIVGPESSVDKLLFGTAEKAVNDLVLDVRRDQMVGGRPDVDAAELDSLRAEWWYTRAGTVMGGSAEVQRGIIADHLLRLPKEKR
ncbi:acyl-CoA dehydrogenase family protein [Gordonia hydrophobica]|uniref:Acyl-CoA dehydrogenase family protein n=1 Tax=Gordonia hydrophobica TaxID=40516 RepID=A0ABZ2TZI3_9ACTN|nr:acyl-CoA dehydrogenase family protein [Gordonia hydrophobica]MBM7369231.1 alkylation response protein AidB-like acyl-CoA dehydrogenase [Gordonia hydrophobica]